MFGSRNGLLIVCGALLFFAVIANAAMKFYNVHVLMENDRLIAHTHQVKERLNSLMIKFVDCASAVRGFAIAGEPRFLHPYHEALRTIHAEFDALTILFDDNPEQQAAVAELRRIHQQHREFLDTVIAIQKERSESEAHDAIKTSRGNALLEQLRQRINQMTAAEDKLLEQRVQVANQRYRQALITGGVGTALSLAIALVAVIVVSQELRRRREAETAYKAQAEESRLNSERFRLLTETVPVHIWISEPGGRAIFLNQSWQNYTGLPLDSEGMERWLEAIHPDDSERLQDLWRKSDGGSKSLYSDEVRVRRAADQSYRWHRCSLVPVRTHRGELQSWVGTLADIQDQRDQSESLEQAVNLRTQELRRTNNQLHEEVVERVRAENRVHAVAAELRRSNQELEKFAYIASHDLQEPLRKIQAFGDRLLRKSHEQLDESGRGYLDRMMVAATRMRTLIDDLLTFSRVATTLRPYAPVDLNTTLHEVLADLETALTQSQGEVDAGPLPTIEADPLQMRQLLQNLIGNALKFAKPGEPPIVTVAATELDRLPETADPPRPGFVGWRLTVADNGIGFEQAHERRIFEVFQRLHGREQYPGTGIGLAICRKIVERHGGAMHARSQPGRGATFIVDLPLVPPTANVYSADVNELPPSEPTGKIEERSIA